MLSHLPQSFQELPITEATTTTRYHADGEKKKRSVCILSDRIHEMAGQQEILFHMQLILLKGPEGVSAGDRLERCPVQITSTTARKEAQFHGWSESEQQAHLLQRIRGPPGQDSGQTVLCNLRCNVKNFKLSFDRPPPSLVWGQRGDGRQARGFSSPTQPPRLHQRLIS